MSGDHEAAPAELYDGHTHVADSPSRSGVISRLEDAVRKGESGELCYVLSLLSSQLSGQVRKWPGDALTRVWDSLLGAMAHSSTAEVCNRAV